jgi:hypothetical protein
MKVSILGFFSLLLLVIQNSLLGQWRLDTAAIRLTKLINYDTINTPLNESSPSFIDGNLYFISDRMEKQFDIYIVRNEVPYNLQLNTKYHEGGVCNCEEAIYFSRSEPYKLDGKISDIIHQVFTDKEFQLKTKEIDKEWINVLHITCWNKLKIVALWNKNSKPDLAVKSNNQFVKDEFSKINTTFTEAFPKLLNDSTLIFSSNRPKGYGGLDLYLTTKKNGIWQNPELLPPPFNSRFDDYGLEITSDFLKGFMASNRPKGKGGDDIYQWSSSTPILTKAKSIEKFFTVNVIDKLIAEPLKDATLELYPINDKQSLSLLKSLKVESLNPKDPTSFEKIRKLVNDPIRLNLQRGEGKQAMNENMDILIKASASGYEEAYFIINSLQWTTLDNLSLPLSPTINQESDITQSVGNNESNIVSSRLIRGIKQVNKGLVLGNANQELEQLVEQLMLNPKLELTMICHTSAISPPVESLRKSNAMGISLKKWMQFKGIDEARLKIIGKGSKEILNQCKEGNRCSQIDHEFNDRVEFIVSNIIDKW